MRKSSIVQDYKLITKPGVFVMKEKTNFNTGIMMDIEDEIRISYDYTDNISTVVIDPLIANPSMSLTDPIYLNYLNYLHDLEYNLNLSGLSYDLIKQNSILTLEQDSTQNKTENETTTKWIFEFDSKYLLREYLYHEIFTSGKDSPFYEMFGILDNNKVKDACYDYINKNLLSRYRLKEFILWTKYHSLKNNIVPGTGTNPILNPPIQILYKTPIFNYNAIPTINTDLNKETISIKSYADGIHDISYKQTASSQFFIFLYYFDVIFEKI